MILLWYNNKYNKYVCTVDIYMYIRLKINQTVLELDFRAVKFLFFPRRDDYKSPV